MIVFKSLFPPEGKGQDDDDDDDDEFVCHRCNTSCRICCQGYYIPN